MSITTLLVFLVVLGFVVGHLVTRYLSRFVWLSGAEYLLVGALLGPAFSPRILTQETLTQLGPLIALLLGLVGFLVGLSARSRIHSAEHGGAGLLSSLGVMLGVTVVFLPLLDSLLGVSEVGDTLYRRQVWAHADWVVELHLGTEQLLLALVVGAAACVSSAAMLDGDPRLARASGPTTTLLRGATSASQIFAVLIFGLVLAVSRATDEANRFGIGVTEWAVAAVAAGAICGLLFSLFLGRERDPALMFLAAVGAVIFASGIGSALGISPLFVNLLAGLVVSATSPHADRVRSEMQRLQHPLFVLVMIFAGAMWAPVAGWLWLCPLAYVVLRLGLRRWLSAAAARTVMAEPVPPRLGNALFSQGTLAVAIGVSFAQRDTTFGPLILTIVVAGTLASDLWSARLLRAVLVDAGELLPGEPAEDDDQTPNDDPKDGEGVPPAEHEHDGDPSAEVAT